MTDSNNQRDVAAPGFAEQRFACPRCDHVLDEALHCSACDVRFPTLAGIPWLFAEPNAALAEWRNRLDFTVKHAQRQATACKNALKKSGLTIATRHRLEHLAQAHTDHVEELSTLLAPLMDAPLTASIESHLALKTRLPGAQGLVSYAANLHRDWAWGQSENDASLDLVAEALGDVSDKRLLVLGAGGGRLAYDLHQRLKPASTTALDYSPLLLLVAHAVIRGESVTMTEFPLAPKRTEHTAIRRTLAAPGAVADGFHLVLADALRAPFESASFDAVVTPWFVDIVGTPFVDTCARVNDLLTGTGTWVSFGSLAFSSPEIDQALSFEETIDTINETGFDVTSTTETDIAYMDCPESRHGRVESVVTLKAQKTESVAKPRRHEALPDWIVRGNAPVPLSPAFKTQATTTRIYAFIMSMIDGKRSIKDMAKLMEEQRLMPRKEAEVSLRGFLTRMFDEGSASDGF